MWKTHHHLLILIHLRHNMWLIIISQWSLIDIMLLIHHLLLLLKLLLLLILHHFNTTLAAYLLHPSTFILFIAAFIFHIRNINELNTIITIEICEENKFGWWNEYLRNFIKLLLNFILLFNEVNNCFTF